MTNSAPASNQRQPGVTEDRKTSWVQENALTLITLMLTTVVAAVVGFYSGLGAARREVAARIDDHAKRLVLVELDLEDLRKRADLDSLFHDIIRQQTTAHEKELIQEIQKAVEAGLASR